jgi:hypothetical protein
VVPFRQRGKGAWFVTAIMINRCIRVLTDQAHKLLPDVAFLLGRIRPKGIGRRGVCLTHQHANQIIALPIGHAFDVQKQLHRLSRDCGQFLKIDFVFADRQGLQFELMGDWRRLPAPFFALARFEQIGELLDGENALFLILLLHACCNAVEQAEVILLLGLRLARALKGAERTMLIQHDGRGLRRGTSCPCVEGVKERHKVCGTLVQVDGMGGPVDRNESASQGRLVLEMSQHIPGKGERQLLFFADAVRPHTHRGFVPVYAASPSLLAPGQDVTHRCQAVSLETGIAQHLTPVAQVLPRVGVYISVLVLQAVKVSLVIFASLLFQYPDVLMGFALLWAAQKQVGFPRTLGICDNDFRRDRRRHDSPLHGSGVVTPLDV